MNNINLTLMGSCLTNFVVKHYLAEYAKDMGINFKVLTSVLQQRSDAIVDMLNGVAPDVETVEHYLSKSVDNGKDVMINGVKTNYSKWFAKQLFEKINGSISVNKDSPDLIIFDTLCDVRHNLYRSKEFGWKVLMGKLNFSDKNIEYDFTKNFEFIGLITPEETISNLEKIFNFFNKINHKLKLIVICFPFDHRYVESRWVDRGDRLKIGANELKNKLPPDSIHIIEFPVNKIKPVEDPSHPNYSPEIWNHFLSSTYKYCSSRIIDIAHKIS